MHLDAMTGVLSTALALLLTLGVCQLFGWKGPVRIAALAGVLGVLVLVWGQLLGHTERLARQANVVAEAISLLRAETHGLDEACANGKPFDAEPLFSHEMRFAPARGDGHLVLSTPGPDVARLVITVDATSPKGARTAVYEGRCEGGERVRWAASDESTVSEQALRLLP